jgi:hypothetical protein
MYFCEAKSNIKQGMVARTYNPSTPEAKTGTSQI